MTVMNRIGLGLICVFLMTGCSSMVASDSPAESRLDSQANEADDSIEVSDDGELILVRAYADGSFWREPQLDAFLTVCARLSEDSWPTEAYFNLSDSQRLDELRARSAWINDVLLPSLSVESQVELSEPVVDIFRTAWKSIYMEGSAIEIWANRIEDWPSVSRRDVFDMYLDAYSDRSDACLDVQGLVVEYIWVESD